MALLAYERLREYGMMNRIKLMLVVVLGTVAWVIPAANAQEQQFPNARPVWENVSSGAIGARVPGRMVRQGTVRFREAHALTMNRARNGPTITEIPPTIKPVNQLKADMIKIIFDDLNMAILLWAGTLLDGDVPPSPEPSEPSDPGADVSELLGTVSGPET